MIEQMVKALDELRNTQPENPVVALLLTEDTFSLWRQAVPTAAATTAGNSLFGIPVYVLKLRQSVVLFANGNTQPALLERLYP